MDVLRSVQETGAERPEFEATCLRVALEESMTRDELSPINKAVIDSELEAALGFELHTENADIARFDCQKVGCTATCGVVSRDTIPISSPRINPGTPWLDGCIKPED